VLGRALILREVLAQGPVQVVADSQVLAAASLVNCKEEPVLSMAKGKPWSLEDPQTTFKSTMQRIPPLQLA